MNPLEKLQLWGTAHGAAREAERQAAQQDGERRLELQRRAQSLRERADRLHGEVYGELETRKERPR